MLPGDLRRWFARSALVVSCIASRSLQAQTHPPLVDAFDRELVGVEFACTSRWIHFAPALVGKVGEGPPVDRFFWLLDGSHRRAQLDLEAETLVLEPEPGGADGEAHVLFARPLLGVVGRRLILSWGASIDDGATLLVDVRGKRAEGWTEWVAAGRSGAQLGGESAHITSGVRSDAQGVQFESPAEDAQVRLRARTSRAGARVRVSELLVSIVDPERYERHTRPLLCGFSPGPEPHGRFGLEFAGDSARAEPLGDAGRGTEESAERASRERALAAIAAACGRTIESENLRRATSLSSSPAQAVDALGGAGIDARARFMATFYDVLQALDRRETVLVIELTVELGDTPRLAPTPCPRHWVILEGLGSGGRVFLLDPAKRGADAKITCLEHDLLKTWLRRCGVAYELRVVPH